MRIIASALVALAIAVPAVAQQPIPAENGDVVATTAPDGSQVPQLPPAPPRELQGLTTPVESGNLFKLAASDFKHFFRSDTARVFAYVSIVAVATAPWDREGVNNGFNIPTTLFESGNMVGNFVFQAGAGFAGYGVGKVIGNKKLATVGRDIVRAQMLSQVMVQAVKLTVRRERPDASNRMSFPSGHSASAFATASVLQHHYGWKAGVPAYALGSYVALARMAWNRHHATDVVMGAAFGLASARTVTMSVAGSQFNLGVRPETGGASLNFTKIYK